MEGSAVCMFQDVFKCVQARVESLRRVGVWSDPRVTGFRRPSSMEYCGLRSLFDWSE